MRLLIDSLEETSFFDPSSTPETVWETPGYLTRPIVGTNPSTVTRRTVPVSPSYWSETPTGSPLPEGDSWGVDGPRKTSMVWRFVPKDRTRAQTNSVT